MARDRKPIPRFWYLPRGEKAVVVMTGDDHAQGGTAGRFNQYISLSPAGCSVANWECIRGDLLRLSEQPAHERAGCSRTSRAASRSRST